MMRLYAIISAIILGVSSLQALEVIDSISYALGHQLTLSLLSEENSLMQDKEDFENYIRGLEDNLSDMTQLNDSSYMMSYAIGGMQAIFLSERYSHRQSESTPPFDCIVAGLRKVGQGKIVLPADTIEAIAILRQYGKGDVNPSELDEETRCRFFTAYGIMKAYTPELQQYINEIQPGTSCRGNPQAFVTGMADLIELSTKIPANSYDLGKNIALTWHINAMTFYPRLDRASFVAGARAALNIGEQLIPQEVIEQTLEQTFMQHVEATEAFDDEAKPEPPMDYISQMDVDFYTEYSVDWSIVAGNVARDDTAGCHSFEDLLLKHKLTDARIAGILMAHTADESGMLYDIISSAIRNYPLPKGFKWFCSKRENGDLIVGIMETSQSFNAIVHKATIEYDPFSGLISVQWKYEADDAARWAQFTEANIGRYVAVEINGLFMSAPKVNSQIKGGCCSITGLLPKEINLLFKDAAQACTGSD